MKILLINDTYAGGGTETQTHREYKLFTERGHDVYLLTLDNTRNEVLSGNKINLRIDFKLHEKLIHKFTSTRFVTERIREIIENIHPDYIHINNILKCPIDVLLATKGYKSIQTIRDYATVCPKKTCIHDDYCECPGYMRSNCGKCRNRWVENKVKLSSLRIINHYRRRMIQCFITPSIALASKCLNNEIPAICVNNPFDFSSVQQLKKTNHGGRKILLYYGAIARHKGISEFFNALDEVNTTNIRVWFAGSIDKKFEHFFMDNVKKREYATYLGTLSYSKIMELYSSIYCVVVPSLWIENYPNTVLEAIANKTLVIGSNRGGIPELIGNENFLFDVTDKISIVKCINYMLNLSDGQYEEITSKRYEYIRINNSMEKYYQRLISIYNSI